jgi:hypothetical protein
MMPEPVAGGQHSGPGPLGDPAGDQPGGQQHADHRAAVGASATGVPGWPERARCTASMASVRMVSIQA